MHPHSAFDLVHILWTITFAAQLVLLVVLLGRDRLKRFPWFATSITLITLNLLLEELLTGRLPQITLVAISTTISDLTVLASLFVLLELARRGFAGVRRPVWIAWTTGLLLVAGGALAIIGSWPQSWKDYSFASLVGRLRIMQLFSQNGDMLVYLLTVELALLVVLFGNDFKAGWKTHVQKIVIGLTTVALSAVCLQTYIKTLHPTSREQYQHIVELYGKLVNADRIVYIVALIWWIACLWFNEPGTEQSKPEHDSLPE